MWGYAGSTGWSLDYIARAYAHWRAAQVEESPYRQQAEANNQLTAVQAIRQQQDKEAFSNIKEAEWSLIPPSTEC